ncbi:MAG: DUF3606 domain-containing protein [Chitinophagaceae bacterium]|nr:DUF3606 domain-containing protein [Chitinophagaceae bacterium]
MSYYKRQNSRQEQKRLNIDEEYEIMDWTERYGVPADRIREVVRVVGDRVTDVVRYLMDGNKTNQFSNR